MKVEVKNLEILRNKFSNSILGFVCDLYIDSKRAAWTDVNFNNEQMVDIRPIDGAESLINEARDYFRSQPKVRNERYNYEYQPTLESEVIRLVKEEIKGKI